MAMILYIENRSQCWFSILAAHFHYLESGINPDAHASSGSNYIRITKHDTQLSVVFKAP